MIFETLPEAETEFLEIILFLESEESGLGDRFVSATEKSVRLLQSFPELGSPVFVQFRRFVLRPFSYYLIYMIHSEKSIIVAFSHHSRKPGYWKNRPN